MMTKKKTPGYMAIVYVLMLPACAIALMSLGNKRNPVGFKVLSAQQITATDTPDIFPVDPAKVASVVPYGRAADRRTGKMRKHTGIDFDLAAGSDVVATADGVIIAQAYDELRGNHVLIRHNEMFSTRYFHLEAAMVKQGERVKKGHVIGLVGNTGLSAAPHLHYEVLKNFTVVDPKDYLPAFTLPAK